MSTAFHIKQKMILALKNNLLEDYKAQENKYISLFSLPHALDKNVPLSPENQEFLEKNIQTALSEKNLEAIEYMLCDSVLAPHYQQSFHNNDKILNFLGALHIISMSSKQEDIDLMPKKIITGLKVLSFLFEKSLVPDIISAKYLFNGLKSLPIADRQKMYKIVMPFFDKKNPPGIITSLQECIQSQDVIGFKRSLEALMYSQIPSQTVKNLLLSLEEEIPNFYHLEDYHLALAEKEKKELHSQVAVVETSKEPKIFKL